MLDDRGGGAELMPRLGLMLCSGCGIGESLDMQVLGDLAGELGAAATITHPALCGPEGLEAIRTAVKEENLEGVLIAAVVRLLFEREVAVLTSGAHVVFPTPAGYRGEGSLESWLAGIALRRALKHLLHVGVIVRL